MTFRPPAILDHFSFAHLPGHLAVVSKPFHDLAQVVSQLPDSDQRAVALQRLLEAKDAAVRARLGALRSEGAT